MNSICLSVVPNLRCQELTRIENIVLLVPPGVELLFSLTLAIAQNNAGGRKRWFLVLDGVSFFLLALADFLAHFLTKISSDVRVFRIVDIVMAAASCLPIISYTVFLFLFARSELISVLPSRFKYVATLALLAVIPPIVAFNEVSSLLGVTYTPISSSPNNGRNLAGGVAISCPNLLFQRLSLFFSSAGLVLLTLFQASLFVLTFVRLVRAFLDERRTEAAASKPDETGYPDDAPEEIHLFRGVGWITAGLKLGAIETVVGFTNMSFAAVIIRRSLRLFARGITIIAVIKGMNIVENLDKFESDVRALRGGVLSSNRNRTRYYSTRRLSSRRYSTPPLSGTSTSRFMNPRNSSFREISPNSPNSFPQVEKRKGRIGPSPLALELNGDSSAGKENPPGDLATPNDSGRVTVHYDGKTPPVLHLRFSTLSLAPPPLLLRPVKENVARVPATAIPAGMATTRTSVLAKRAFSLPALMEDPREHQQGQGEEHRREQSEERRWEEQERQEALIRAVSMPMPLPPSAAPPMPMPAPTSTSALTPTPTLTPTSTLNPTLTPTSTSRPVRPPRARPPSQGSERKSSSTYATVVPSAQPSDHTSSMLTPAALTANTIASSVMLPVTPRPVRVRPPSTGSDPLVAVREMAGRFPDLPSHVRESQMHPQSQISANPPVQAQVPTLPVAEQIRQSGARSVSVYSSEEDHEQSQDGLGDLQSPLQTVETISKSMSKSMMSMVSGAEMGTPSLTRETTLETPALITPSSNLLPAPASTPPSKGDGVVLAFVDRPFATPRGAPGGQRRPNLSPRMPLQIQVQPQSLSTHPNVLTKPYPLPARAQQQESSSTARAPPSQQAPTQLASTTEMMATLAERRRRRVTQVHQKLAVRDAEGDKVHPQDQASTGVPPANAGPFVTSSSSLPSEADKEEAVLDDAWRRAGLTRLKSVNQVQVHMTPPAEQLVDVRGSLMAVEEEDQEGREAQARVVKIGPVPTRKASAEAARRRREKRESEAMKRLVRSDSGVLGEEDRKWVRQGNVS